MAEDPSKPDREAADAAANEAPPDEAIVTDATMPVGEASEAHEAPPAADALVEPTGEQPAPIAPSEPPVAEQWAEAAEPTAPTEQSGQARAEGQSGRSNQRRRRRQRAKDGQERPQGERPRQREGPRQPREKGPLPFQELRAAAETMRDVLGQRRALRDAFSVLGDKERQDLARLVSEDGDWRVRARNIAAGSLGAGRLGKAIAAQGLAMANIEDLWALTLSKEEAAERVGRIRDAKRRDERRAKRQQERQQSSDRVSRAELEKAQDGRVGAQVRIVFTNEKGQRRKKGDDEPPPDAGGSVLDRLGY